MSIIFMLVLLPAVFTDKRDEPDAPVQLLKEPVAVPFEHHEFLGDASSDRGDQSPVHLQAGL